ncbi:MAG: DNA repair protein RadC [Lachnospiraceae bacterium]|nr:DNA repair protein RadC [Lachnospiraceae bacterium]
MREKILRINERHDDDKPYEKCRKSGPGVLTDSELLAVLLRTGTRDMDVMMLAEHLVHGEREYEGISSILHYTYEELTGIKGIGPVKAVQILCISELVQRIWKSSITDKNSVVRLKTPSDCARFFSQEMRYLEKEELKIAYLDIRYRLIDSIIMTRGTCDSSLVSVRDILEGALKKHAARLLMIHNHPYSDALPSDADIEATNKVSEGAEAIGIKLIDHIIIGSNDYFSFKEKGLLD